MILLHALKNSLITLISVLGVYIPIFISTSVIVESVFGLPGLGRLAVAGAIGRDYPVVLTANLVAIVAVIGSGLLTDLAYTVVDPRIRLHER